MEETEGKQKRQFDKKKWRELKYSKTARVKQWEEKRKKVMKHKLNRQLRKEGKSFKGPEQKPVATTTEGRKVDILNTLKERKKQKEAKAKTLALQAKEREEALQRYKKKKIEKAIKLTKKTKKGQPLMNARVELLYKQIQESLSPGTT